RLSVFFWVPSEISLEHGLGAHARLNAAAHFGNGLIDFFGSEAHLLALLARAGDIGLELIEQLDFFPGREQRRVGNAHGRDLVLATHVLAKAVKYHDASPLNGPKDP